MEAKKWRWAMEACYALIKSINFLAVLCGVIWAIIVGNIWYSPKVFFDVWAKELGLKKVKITKEAMMRGFGMMILMTAIEMLSLAGIITLMGGGIVKAVHAGLLISLGMMAASRLSEAFFEQRSVKAWLIQSGFNTISILGASVILGLWK
jgi:hypothetical protein